MANGLLGLGGFSGIGGVKPPPGLLGNYFDPAEMRRQQMKQALLGAGIGMLTNGKGSFGEVLGQGFAGGLQGASQAGQNYRNDAMLYSQMEQQKQDRQRTIAQQNTEMGWKLEDRDRAEKERTNIMDYIHSLPPEEQKLAEAFPAQYAAQYMQQKFSTTAPKAPTMETLYDEKTGQQYKAQWNPVTQKWDRVGGLKPDDNGITITNPDGTTTQIGGGGAKTTEADRRAQLLTKQVMMQEPQLMADFDSLASVQNYIGGSTGTVGRGAMTAEGQMAKDSLTNVLANWLYLTSGATMNQGEIDRQIGLMLPTPMDDPKAIAAKKARVQSIFDTMKERAGVQSAPAVNGVPQKKPPLIINGYKIEEIP